MLSELMQENDGEVSLVKTDCNERPPIVKLDAKEVPFAYNQFITPYFPENEVKPLASILGMMQSNLYSVYAMKECGEIVAVAFLTTYPNGNAFLLDYLAVSENVRSKGYGSRILSEIKNLTNGLPILIETESLESAETEAELLQRRKRNAFYERAGAVMSDTVTLIFGAEYNNWVLGDKDKINITDELSGIYHFMVSKEKMYKENVFIPK